MATINGTIEFATAGNNKLQGKVDWYATANGPVANNSTVDAIIYARRPDGYGPTTGQSWSGYVKVGSIQQNISLSSSVSVNTSWVEMARITGAIIAHNANGTGSVAISGSVTGPSNTSLANITSSGSGTATLETIPRYFSNTPTITLTSKTETSFTLTWNTSETCSKVVLNVGGSTYSTTNVNAKTGSLTISGRSANTSYAVYGTFTRSDSGLTTNSATATWQTYQYPYVSGVTTANLKIGNQQVLSLYNPLNRSVSVYMKKDNTSGTQLYSGTTSGTSITFTPTANTLYASISNSTSGNAVYYCTYSSHTISSKSGTYSIIGTEVPTFSNFTAVDNNSTTTSLTGNSGIIVKGYSNILVTIPVADKAIANNSATMKSYKIQVGTMTAISKDYSSTTNVTATQNNANSNQVSVSAIDSRGLAKTVSKTLTIKNYFKPYITDYTATRGNSGTATETTLTFTINFWNESFGNAHNSIRTIGYKYKESGTSQWTTGTTTLTYTTSGNKATGSVSVNGDAGASGFTLGTAYDIQIFMTDALDSALSTALLLSGTPAIAIAGNKVAIGGPVESNALGDLQVKGDVGVTGTIYGDLNGTATNATNATNISITTTNPSSASWYNIPFVSGPSGNQLAKANDGVRVATREGSTSVIGLGQIELGNAVSSGTTGNKKGHLVLFSEKNGNVVLKSIENLTSTLNVYLPQHGGYLKSATTLYENTSGVDGNFTLSESIANFDYIEVFFRERVYRQGYMRFLPTGYLTDVPLSIMYHNGDTMYHRTVSYQFSGTSATKKTFLSYSVKPSTKAITNEAEGTNAYIKIYKVVGWK